MPAEQFELEQSGNVVTARVREAQISHMQMKDLADECLDRLRIHGGSHVLLDMERVEYLSSACLGPLVSLLQDLEHLRGKLAVCRCTDNVAFLLRVTRLDAVINVYEEESEARAEL